MSRSSLAPRRDVRWVKDNLGSTQPAWNTQPSLLILESIMRDHLAIPVDTPCPISPFARGAFNELYVVHSSERAYLIRVTLPVQPRLKTLSEVTTIEFVRAHASELVPRVLAYNADARSLERGGLGFEWMIMEKIPGSALDGRWEGMDWDAKLILVKTVVGVFAKLHDCPLSGIGNIYPATADAALDGMAPPTAHTVGQIVSMTFFWDDHFDQDVPRGPFRASHDWLAACLQFILNDSVKVIDRAQAVSAHKADTDTGEDADTDGDSEDELEEAEETKALAEGLVRLLPRVFLPAAPDAPPERTVIFHDDLSSQNILVDASGALAGLVDWECVSALPLWRACTLPWFLIGRHRAERPNPEMYGRAEDEDEDEDGDEGRGRDGNEDRRGRPSVLYFEHLLEWEQTQLRTVFLDEMERLQQEWVDVHRAGGLRNDFYTAVMHCDDELCRRRVRQWVGWVEAMADEELQGGALSSEYISLNEMLQS